MPTRATDVKRFFERMIVLETQVKNLLIWQKWQMALLSMILVAFLSRIIK